MKKITTAVVLFMMLSVFAIIAGCGKKEIQGPKGDPGTPGGGGNSSISNSEIFTVFSSQWKANADNTAWEYSFASTLLTQQVVDKGAVKIYIKRNDAWTELPNTEGDLFMQFSFNTGFVNLTYLDIHGLIPTRPATADYRLMTIYQDAKTPGKNANIITTPGNHEE